MPRGETTKTAAAGPALREQDAFVGRTDELDELRRLLERGARLVTVTGPGGALAADAATADDAFTTAIVTLNLLAPLWVSRAANEAMQAQDDGGAIQLVAVSDRAAAAGIGWQGKHTNLLSRELGSWLFLGEIFTTLDLPPDRPAVDHCGTCDRCLKACPTGALPEPYRIEPRRCISYLTIEHKGAIEPELMALMGNRVYGCDDCLAACPVPESLFRLAGQAHRPRPLRAQRADRHRQQRRPHPRNVG